MPPPPGFPVFDMSSIHIDDSIDNNFNGSVIEFIEPPEYIPE